MTATYLCLPWHLQLAKLELSSDTSDDDDEPAEEPAEEYNLLLDSHDLLSIIVAGLKN